MIVNRISHEVETKRTSLELSSDGDERLRGEISALRFVVGLTDEYSAKAQRQLRGNT
jgi:hypothetical protein